MNRVTTSAAQRAHEVATGRHHANAADVAARVHGGSVSTKHRHDFEQVEKAVPIYQAVVYRSGKAKISHQVGKDTLKQLRCRDESCGRVVTVDLERFKA